MIKNIELQKPAQIAIVKDGEVVASLHISDIKGHVDIDKIKMSICENRCGMSHNIRLEV